jgi:hypothetical protein
MSKPAPLDPSESGPLVLTSDVPLVCGSTLVAVCGSTLVAVGEDPDPSLSTLVLGTGSLVGVTLVE